MQIPGVVYSANIRLGGGGMGGSVLEILKGLERAHLLRQVIVSSVKGVPLPPSLVTTQGFLGRAQKRLAFYDSSGWGDYIVNRIFDRWAGRAMKPADIFESWTGFCMTSLQRAKRRGSLTLLNLGSAHPRTQMELINSERVRWGLAPLRETPLIRQVEREIELADRIIVQSSFSEHTLVERGVSPEKLTRISLGVNVERFHLAQDRPAHPFRVLFVGQVTLRKGIGYLLEAWKQLGWQDAELMLVGQIMPDCQAVLKHYAGLPGLTIQGYVADLVAAYQSADVFVSPSVEDGFGLVVPEAMACGLPVVVSDHTGASDLVRNGEAGLVVRYNDPAQYARALEELRSHAGRAREMGRAGRDIALRQTWNVYCDQIVHLHMEASHA